MLEVVMAVVLVTMLVVTIGAVFAGRNRNRGANPEQGTLAVSGVSPLPEMTGEHYVTITGTLTGPTVAGKVVYRRFAWDAAHWPAIGDHLTVAYSPRDPDDWYPDHPGQRPYLGS
ncbi:hypothetical protein ACFWUP_12045 [Nocardia sp. NPDC058658]|uniref:hypothetical protein n=1 Tax=Nocardia sp. NPDC058658 TaxID=3346580 RepID=UPI003666F82E